MVASGAGVAVMPSTAADPLVDKEPMVHVLPFAGTPPARTVGLVWRAMVLWVLLLLLLLLTLVAFLLPKALSTILLISVLPEPDSPETRIARVLWMRGSSVSRRIALAKSWMRRAEEACGFTSSKGFIASRIEPAYVAMRPRSKRR